MNMLKQKEASMQINNSDLEYRPVKEQIQAENAETERIKQIAREHEAKRIVNMSTAPKQDTYTPVQNTQEQTEKQTEKQNKDIVKKAIAAGGIALSGIVAFVKRKDIARAFGKVSSHFSGTPAYKLEQVDTKWPEDLGKTTTEAMKKFFNDEFLNPLKKGEVPKNGFLAEGPASEGKKQFFDWCIEQMRKAGVEIIDSTDPKLGHSTKRSITKIFNFINEDAEKQFKKDGKYKLFVIKGMEKIGNPEKTTKILKDLPHDCAANNGLILAYECLDSSNFYYSVTRPGRIDRMFMPSPLETESLSKWKEFLEFIKPTLLPKWAAKRTDEAREMFTKQGAEVLEEMKPYLKYNAPFKMPDLGVALDGWREYITETTKILEPRRQFIELSTAAQVTVKDYLYKRIPKKQYQSIIDMIMENIPEQSKSKMTDVVNAALNQRVG